GSGAGAGRSARSGRAGGLPAQSDAARRSARRGRRRRGAAAEGDIFLSQARLGTGDGSARSARGPVKPDAWLLLRGLAREQRHWGAFLPALQAALPDARVHCLDLPGAGTEHARTSPANARSIAEDVRQRWLALGPAN